MQKNIFQYCYNKYGDLFGDNFNEKLVYDAYVSTPIVEAMISPEMTFYRIRKNINEEEEDITNPATFSYPEERFCTENGRANIYGFPAFYCSDTVKVTISEVRPEQYDYLYVSLWNTNSVSNALLGIIASENAIKNSVFRQVYSFIKKHSNDIEDNKKFSKWLLVKDKISKIFLEEFHPYANSSVYSYLMMYLNNVDIIVYPSMKWKYNFTNIVVKKEYVDKHLELNKVYKVQMIADSHYCSSISLLNIGNVFSNKISWSPPKPPDLIEFFNKFIIDECTFALKYPKDATDNTFRDMLNDIDCKLIKTSIEQYSEKDIKKAMEFYSLGLKQIEYGNYYKALNYFDQCVSLCTYIPSFYYQRGLCNFYINKYDDAIIDYTNAIRLRENNIGDSNLIHKVYCNRGTIYQYQKQYDKAISDFEKAIKHESRDHIAIFNLGNCLVEIGKYSEAILAYEDALKLKPDDDEIINNRNYAIKLKGKA